MQNANNKNFIILMTALFITVGQFCITLYLPALPSVADDLHVSINAAQLSMSIFLISFGFSQLIYGFLSDRIRRKKCILAGLSIVILSTLMLILTSHSYTGFMIFRFLQGLGAGSVSVLARAIIRDSFSKEDLNKALSFIIMSVSLSPAISPFIGGWITHYFGWLMVFKILLVYTIVISMLIVFFLPETLRLSTMGEASPSNIKMALIQLFSHESYLCCVFIVVFSYACQIMYLTVCPFIFAHTYHVSPAVYGTLFLIPASGFFIGNLTVNRMTKKIHGHQFMTAGIALLITASLSLFLVPAVYLTKSLFIAIIFVLAVGVAFIFTNSLTYSLKPFGKIAGAAAAISGVMQMLGSASIIAIVGYFHIETTKPFALSLLCCCTLVLLLFVIVRKRLV